MKIAVFTDVYAPWATGGIVSSVRAQKAELEELGHEVVVFCPGYERGSGSGSSASGSARKAEQNVVVVPTFRHLKVNGVPLAKRPATIEQFVLAKFPEFGAEFDVVHVHYEACCSIAGVRLAKRFGVPLVQTMHGREDRAVAVNVPLGLRTVTAGLLNWGHGLVVPHTVKVRRDKFQAPTFARAKMWELMVNQAAQADLVLTPSRHFAQKLEHYGVAGSIRVLSNGVDSALMETEFAERTMQEGAVLKLIWNSRVSREKRVMPFLEALAMLERPYLAYIYGDGNELGKAKRFARKHKLKVKFFGRQPREKILKRMRDAHLGVMASYNFDTQGMTLLEAMATGLPVFFCDPAMEEVVPAGSFVLAGGPDALSMAMALEDLWPGKIAKMSQVMMRNRKKAGQAAQIKELVKLYKSVLR